MQPDGEFCRGIRPATGRLDPEEEDAHPVELARFEARLRTASYPRLRRRAMPIPSIPSPTSVSVAGSGTLVTWAVIDVKLKLPDLEPGPIDTAAPLWV